MASPPKLVLRRRRPGNPSPTRVQRARPPLRECLAPDIRGAIRQQRTLRRLQRNGRTETHPAGRHFDGGAKPRRSSTPWATPQDPRLGPARQVGPLSPFRSRHAPQAAPGKTSGEPRKSPQQPNGGTMATKSTAANAAPGAYATPATSSGVPPTLPDCGPNTGPIRKRSREELTGKYTKYKPEFRDEVRKLQSSRIGRSPGSPRIRAQRDDGRQLGEEVPHRTRRGRAAARIVRTRPVAGTRTPDSGTGNRERLPEKSSSALREGATVTEKFGFIAADLPAGTTPAARLPTVARMCALLEVVQSQASTSGGTGRSAPPNDAASCSPRRSVSCSRPSAAPMATGVSTPNSSAPANGSGLSSFASSCVSWV